MEIKIFKNKNDKICFKVNSQEDKEFTYDSFDYLIDLVYDNDEKVEIDCDDDYEDYKKLLEGIILESRKDDYRAAINNAKESNIKLSSAEENSN